jgi:hypothetical protein
MMVSFIICILHKILLGDHIKKSEMDGICITRRRNKKCIHSGEISGSHGDEYEDNCLLGCSAV